MDSAKGTAKQLKDLSKIYMEAVYGGKKKEEKKDTRLTVTNADKTANTPAWQKYKAGSTAYKAADHVKEGKDESPEAEEEKDKEDDDLAGSPNKKGKKAKRWWDDDGDGKGYEKGEVDGKFPDKDGSKKKKVKEEVEVDESVGSAIDKTLGAAGEIADTAIKLPAKAVGYVKGLKKGLKKAAKKGEDKAKGDASPTNEETILEKQKDTPDQVAAVIDMYRSKKGTDEATKDSEEGKTKAAKKERDYAKWERDKMARDAQKSGHPWKHAKGSTTEKEGKKSVKHAHVQDSYDWQNESKEAKEYLDTVSDVKDAELKADIKRWSALEESGKFTAEEIESLKEADRLGKSEVYILDEIDDDLLQFIESSLGNLPEDQILDLMESGWHRRNPGKKHPLESGSTKTQRRPVSDQEKKSTDKEDRMYVAMRRVTDRQKGYNADKSKAAGRLHDRYTTRQSKRKAGASPKEASAQSFGEFGGKDFAIKRGGRKGKAPATDRGTGNKAARRAGQEVKNRDPRK